MFVKRLLGFSVAFAWLAAAGCQELAQGPAKALSKDDERKAAVELMERLKAAGKAGAGQFRIEPGVYRFQENGKWSLASISGIKGMRIDAKGASFVFESWKFGLLVSECEDLVIDGLAIDYDPLPYTQGTVTAIHEGEAPGSSFIEYRQDPGFPPLEDVDYDPVLKLKSEPLPVVVFDPEGKRMVMNQWGRPSKIERLAEGAYRVFIDTPSYVYPNPKAFTSYSDYKMSAGCKIALLHRTSGTAILIYKSSGVQCRDVTVYSSPGGAFTDLGHHAWRGGQVFESCKVLRKPGGGRLFSSNGDAYHSYLALKGPAIRNCVAEYVGDDFGNIRGTMSVVMSSPSDKTLYICMRAEFESESVAFPGASVSVIAKDSGYPRGEAKILSIEKCRSKEILDLAVKAKPVVGVHGISSSAVYKLELDKPVQAGFLDYVAFPDSASGGFEMTGNRFSHGLARGVRLQSSDGLFAGNLIDETCGTSLSVSIQCDWLEGSPCKNLVIKDNVFSSPHFQMSDAIINRRLDVGAGSSALFSSVFLKCESRLGVESEMSYPIHSGVVFEGNKMLDARGPGLYLDNASKMTAKGNLVELSSALTPATASRLCPGMEGVLAGPYLDKSSSIIDNPRARLAVGEGAR